ncbi:MAG: hypothetical protein HQ475_05030 [SAR202 cluster bacterium]|nr:hypothetical protein [SAR202 cluster bacterium]
MSSTVKVALVTASAFSIVVIVAFWVLDKGSAPVFSRLEEALNMVPDPFDFLVTKQPIEFADYLGSRQAAGLDQVVGFQAYLSLPEGTRQSLYRGLPTPGGRPMDFQTDLYAKLAIDLYAFDFGVWVSQPNLRECNFVVLQGTYDKEKIVNKMMGLGYKGAQHSGVKYYWLFEETTEETTVDLAHPLGFLAPYVNRVAFMDGKLLLGSADIVIESLIDVQLGNVPSMRADRNYVRLVRSSPEGVLGGVLLDYRWLRDTWHRFSNQYPETPDTWGTLANYTLVLFGYGQTGEFGQTILAVYARNSATAGERNAVELVNRWNTFRPGAYHGDFVKNFCSPLSTSVIERKDRGSFQSRGLVSRTVTGSYSVLNGTSQIIEGEDSDVATQGADLWRTLYESRQLTFLIRMEDI